MIIETPRLGLRRLTQEDKPALEKILKDPVAMAAYEHAFSDTEVQGWLDNQLKRYAKYENMGLWAVVLKENGEMIGQCGLTMQPVGDREVLEIGYLFQRAFWHKGYAIEAARACRDYAFKTLGAPEVFSIIRDTNIASQNVAIRNGMLIRERFIKHYYGVDMPHLLYSVRREDI